MSQQTSPPPAGGWNFGSLMRDVGTAWRLLWDPNVPGLLKLTLPVLALLYWVWPIDLIPGLPVDDIAVLLLAAKLFVTLASSGTLNSVFGGSGKRPHPYGTHRPDDADVIDTTWRVVDE